MDDERRATWIDDLVRFASPSSPSNDEPSPQNSRILDAALTVLGKHGDDHLTIDMVADQARMSRMTVFRRFGSKDNLLAQTYRRELARVLNDVAAHAAATTSVADRCATIAIRLVECASESPIVNWQLRVAPEQVLHLWRNASPSGQSLGVDFYAAMLADPELADCLATERARIVADTMIRIVMAHILVPENGHSGASPDFGAHMRDLATRLTN